MISIRFEIRFQIVIMGLTLEISMISILFVMIIIIFVMITSYFLGPPRRERVDPAMVLFHFMNFSQSFKASRVTFRAFRAFLNFSMFRHLKLIPLLIVIIIISNLSAYR